MTEPNTPPRGRRFAVGLVVAVLLVAGADLALARRDLCFLAGMAAT